MRLNDAQRTASPIRSSFSRRSFVVVVLPLGTLLVLSTFGGGARAASRPLAAQATVGGTWVEFGRPTPRREVRLERKVSAGQPKVVAKTRTAANGRYVFPAVQPGTYRVVAVLVLTSRFVGKQFRVLGFTFNLGAASMTPDGPSTVPARSAFFAVKSGARITKDIVVK